MADQDFPRRVTQGEDGVYRWRYDLDMYKNPYLLKVLLKIMGVICAAAYFFLLFLMSGSSYFEASTLFLAALPFLGAMALTAVGYYIAAAAMHGVYHLRFEMDENSIRLVRKESTQRMMNVVADVAVMSGMRNGRALQNAAESGSTAYSQVRGVKEHPGYDAFNLREIVSANQIWVCPEDYAFVRDYVLARVPEKVRSRKPRPRLHRLRNALLASLTVNMSVFFLNLIYYGHRSRLLLYIVVPQVVGEEWQSVGMRFTETAAWGGIVRYDLLLLVLPILLGTLVFYLLLSAFALMRRYSDRR